jgi:hypothetical protein
MVAAAFPTWRIGWERLVPTAVLAFVAPAQDAGIRTRPAPPPTPPPPGWSPLAPPSQNAPMLSGLPVLGAMFMRPEPTVGERLTDEMWRRITARQVSGWLARRFVGRYVRATKLDLASLVRVPGEWPVGERIVAQVTAPGIRAGAAFVGTYARAKTWVMDGTIAFLDAGAEERHGLPVEIELRMGTRVLHRERHVLDCEIHGDVGTFLGRAAGSGVDDRVQAAMAPALRWLADGTPVVRVGDRSDKAPWPQIPFGVAYTTELRRVERVLARGGGICEWFRPVWKDWEDVELAWDPGGREAAEGVGGEGGVLTLVIRGDPHRAGKAYVECPFGKRPECWAGAFEIEVQGPPPR